MVAGGIGAFSTRPERRRNKMDTSNLNPCFSDNITPWRIANAKKHNLTRSEFHPDEIRRQIAELKSLLKESETVTIN